MEQQTLTNYSTPYKFSGKEKDEETSYSYFGARYYMSDVSVWLSVDPLADDAPGWTPYRYCFQNPIMLIDPDGMSEGLPDGFTMDKKGNLTRVDDTGGDKYDVIYSNDYDKDKGTFTPNKDESKALRVEKGVIQNSSVYNVPIEDEETRETVKKDASVYKFSSSAEKEKFYNFAITNSFVEWQRLNVSCDGTNEFYVGTNHHRRAVNVRGIFLEFNYRVTDSAHNHPGGRASPSRADKTSAGLLPNTVFNLSIVLRGVGSQKPIIINYRYNGRGMMRDKNGMIIQKSIQP